MSKNTCVIYAPIETYSGYGANARDKVKAIIDLKKDEWDIKIISCRWGSTPMNFLSENPEWAWLKSYIIPGNLNYQPDYMFWITIPPEAQAIGKWNCLITAGIETTICAPSWIEGINRMDLTLVSSNHAKNTFMSTRYEKKDNRSGQIVGALKIEKPIEVLMEGCNPLIYQPITRFKDFHEIDLYNDINSIPELFSYLFVGHFLQGEFGEDRKNVSLLIKAFYETFKNTKNPPALILKTSGASSSYMDRREIHKRIDNIRKTVRANKIPNIYLLHGEFSDSEMNELYNHPKIGAMINLTKGEGFGRPLLEFSLTNKPIIASNWSGHTDFLNPEFTALVPGELRPIHRSAQVKDILIEGSQWFAPSEAHIGQYLRDVFENQKEWQVKGKRQGYHSRTNFSSDKMKEKLNEYLKIIPSFPTQVQLKLPSLKKISLPSLKKIES